MYSINLTNKTAIDGVLYMSKVFDLMKLKTNVLQLNLEAESKRTHISIENLRRAFYNGLGGDENIIPLAVKKGKSSCINIAHLSLVGDICDDIGNVKNPNYLNEISAIGNEGPVFEVFTFSDTASVIKEGYYIGGVWIYNPLKNETILTKLVLFNKEGESVCI